MSLLPAVLRFVEQWSSKCTEPYKSVPGIAEDSRNVEDSVASAAVQFDTFTTKDRLLRLTTPLPEDVLLVESFSAFECISGLFEMNLQLISTLDNAPDITAEKLIGSPVALSVSVFSDFEKGPWRYFNGIVSRFHKISSEGSRFNHYQAVVVPWLWLLTLDSKCRIYQAKTVPAIVKHIFDEYGQHFSSVVSFKDTLTKAYTKLDYCVQYRESSFNFISRLLESEGIFYYFEHSEDKHTLVLADAPSAHKPCPEQPKGRLVGSSGWGESDNPILTWDERQELRPGKYTMRDFHFQMPSKNLEVAESSLCPFDACKPLEIYHYPGEYASRFNDKQRDSEVQPEAEKFVRLRIEEQEAMISEASGTSLCRAFSPGQKFELDNGAKSPAKYVITAVRHSGVQVPWYVADEEHFSSEDPYQNSFSCIPQNVVFRPQRRTPKPAVSGPQTAIVVGKAGEEIWTDEFGRVKVQFHWDREGKRDENSSCWVRVSQPWAGKNWGTVSIPRIGQEVVIDFLEGDPDQPIITGRVYNSEQTPPYKLPGGAVISGIKTNSTKGGGGYNEMSMDDTKGKEKVTIHSQYNMSTTVEHDDSQTVHNNRVIAVDGTHTETIKKDTVIIVTEGKEVNTVKQQIEVTSQTQYIYLTAATEIKLEVGQSKLHMFADGRIQITGQNIAIDGAQKVRTHAAEVTSEADMQHQTKGAIVVSEGSATNTVKGAMVMLNP
ncbi:MAG TPA: type VI secretion system tip protein VgrG [Bryobacteraceae bacterium]|nr:type VI secretion system tip protein VgrG [Bryobacteraceae bacterium]